MTQKIKQIIIASIVIVAAFVGFKMFFSSSEPADVALTADSAQTAQFADGQLILALLNKLSRVTIDDTIFQDQTFVSLTSFEKPIQDQVAGRKNPFLPIGFDGGGSAFSTSSTSRTERR